MKIPHLIPIIEPCHSSRAKSPSLWSWRCGFDPRMVMWNSWRRRWHWDFFL